MKRPLALTGFTCFGVLMAVVCFGYELALLVAGVSLVMFLVSMPIPKLRKRKTLPVALITALLSAVWILTFFYTAVYPVWEEYSGINAQVVAVQSCPGYTDGKYYYNEFKTVSINGEKVSTGFTLATKQPIFTSPYDEITLNCNLEKNEYPQSIAKGNYLFSRIYDEPKLDKTTPDNKPIMAHVYDLNRKLEEALYDELSEEAGDFSSALLLGNKHTLSKEVKDLFKVCGISHIVVVSGLHLSIISSVAHDLLIKISKNRYVNALILSVVVVGFAALTGFGFSIVRAMILQLVIILSGLVKRKGDSVNTLGLAVLIILLPNPLAVADVGLQLSFISTLGIVLWNAKLSEFIKSYLFKLSVFSLKPVSRITKIMVETFTNSVCATIFTIPIIIMTFKRFSAVSILTNMIVVPFMTVIIVLVALCAVCHFVPFMPFLSEICAFFIEAFYRALIYICEAISSLPFAYVNAEDSYFIYWILFTVAISLIGKVIVNKYGKKMSKKMIISCVAVFSAVFLVMSSITYNCIHKHDVNFTVYNTGGTFYAMLECEDGYCVLSAYGSKTVEDRLTEDIEFASSTDSNIIINNGGKNADDIMISLLSSFDYETVLLYDSLYDDKTHEDVEALCPKVEMFSGKHSVDLWDLGIVDIIPVKKYSFEYIDIYNSSILIIPKYTDIKNLPEEYRVADVVLAPEIPKNLGLISCQKLILPEKYEEDEGVLTTALAVAEEVLFETDTEFAIKR